MSRRRQSPFEDLIVIASKLSWKVGCALALISFVVLHGIAGIKLSNPSSIDQMGSIVVKKILITVALFGQLVLPIAFLIGALVSFISAKKRARLYEEVSTSTDPTAFFDMSWQDFEMLVEEYFRRRGYAANRTGGNGPDGGVDIVLSKGSETYLVQCKQWKAQRLGVQAVRELHGVMAAQRATGGFVVCAGRFTDEAKHFAQNINIKLFDGVMLQRMIVEARQPITGEPSKGVSTPLQAADPVCPTCGASMVRKTARKGPNAGKPFWGCSTYPSCRGTVSIPVQA